MSEDELIFGKNTVLAFLEQVSPVEPEGPKSPGHQSPKVVSKIRINKILLASGYRFDPRINRIIELARKNKIPVHNVDRRKLDELAGLDQRHQGVLALISPADWWQLEAFLQKLEQDRAARQYAGQTMDGYVVGLLDGIEDPHNLGAIIRVAEAAGVQGLLLPQHRSAGLTGTVAKVSAGAIAHLPVVRVSNLVQTLEVFKRCGFWVVGLDAEAEQLYTQVDLARPLLVVIGGEGKGLGRLVRQHCDFLAKIPMLGKTESLNAAVASGIFFYEVVRQCSKHDEQTRSGRR